MRSAGGSAIGAFRFVVRGRVQGVGFRYSAIHRASSLGLAGWVRNEADGSVTGFAQGPSDALAQFAAWLAHGPSGASVAAREIVEAAPQAGLSGFGVDY